LKLGYAIELDPKSQKIKMRRHTVTVLFRMDELRKLIADDRTDTRTHIFHSSQRGSVVRTSVFGWGTFSDLCA